MKLNWLTPLLFIASACSAAGDDTYLFENDDIEAPELGTAQQPLISGDVLDCESGSDAARILCELALARVNAELDQAGISIDSDGILFTYDDPDDVTLDTGHSCTVRAKVRHQHATARLGRGADLDFSGDLLSRPLAIKLRLPVQLSAKIDVNQTFGNRLLFGSCNNYASDSYSLGGSLGTTAELLVGFALNPSFGLTDSGDYALILEPEVAVGAKLERLDIDLRVSGVSPITPVLTFVTGFGSTLARSTEALFTGKSVSRIVESTAAWDFGVPVVLGVGALPRPLEDAIFGLVTDAAERRVEQRTEGFRSDLEARLQEQVRRALELDSSGRRSITIKREFIDLIRQLGNGADVFIESPMAQAPSASCFEAANRLCSSCRGCSQCVSEQQRCGQLLSQHRAAHVPLNATPVEPRYTPAAPVPTPPVTPPAQPGTPSGASCAWTPFTGASIPGGHVEVSRPAGPCTHSTRERYFTNGGISRTEYR